MSLILSSILGNAYIFPDPMLMLKIINQCDVLFSDRDLIRRTWFFMLLYKGW